MTASAVTRPLIADSVLELIGATPLVRLHRVVPAGATVLGKLENLNPGGSVKDRIALAMIPKTPAAPSPRRHHRQPTSGNTGIGLALVAAISYRLVLTMPEDMSVERRRLFERYGAELVLTPAIEG
jgi:cysteine synthase A